MASMGLAAPRRKVKYDIDPRNNAWANDENKFGQKMLEKFGWAQGKGLGANEDGKTDNIKVKVKNDKLGIGSDNDYSDTWLDHQDDFNAVLAQLANNHASAPNSGAASPAPEAGDVSSMEERSKTSKARVHYKKFTRGKDLKRANADDLDALFGVRRNYEKRTKKKKTPTAITTTSQSAPVTPAGGRSPVAEEKADEEGSVDREYDADGNLRTVTSTLSVADYFAQKMAALKAQGALGAAATTFCDNAAKDAAADDRVDGAVSKDAEESNKPEVYAQEKFQKSAVSVQEYFRMKMEEKKARAETREAEGEGEERVVEESGEVGDEGKKKKKKVKGEVTEEGGEQIEKRKKKKKKLEINGQIVGETLTKIDRDSTESETATDEDNRINKKRKKKRIKESEVKSSFDPTPSEPTTTTDPSEPKKRKKKKKKKVETESESRIEEEQQQQREDQPPPRKKKKMKSELCLDEPPLPNVGQRKKKKKKVKSD